jgi:hypothetical protein
MIWGFGGVPVEINSARDLGTRMVAAIFYRRDAFSSYSAIVLLTNISATIFASTMYELILRDSFTVVAKGSNIHEEGKSGLRRYLTKIGALEAGIASLEDSFAVIAKGSMYKKMERTYFHNT